MAKKNLIFFKLIFITDFDYFELNIFFESLYKLYNITF